MAATNSSTQMQQATGRAANKFLYSAPVSPTAAPASPSHTPALETATAHAATSSPASGAPAAAATNTSGNTALYSSNLSTPKKQLLDAVMLQRIREKLRTPGGACELPALWGQLECTTAYEPVNVIKDRYLISTHPLPQQQAATKTPASYRHLIDLTCSNLKCTDVFTEQEFLCKIINEPLHKVQRAYFQLQQEGEHCISSIYDHQLIRGVHDIVPLSSQRTYVIIAAPQMQPTKMDLTAADSDGEDEEQYGIYEDLHTYIRNKRRLCETEARALFHQICQTVQVCHRNGIILRDLKLKRFYFIDEARTKLQYESLEGSMILDNPADDTLSDKIGCPLYTAPELLCPNPTYRGKPADMWSLGVILYTMLVGQYPFYEKGNCNLITVIRHCHVQIPSNLSRSVRMLLLALLRKNHEERIPAHHIFYSPWLREQLPYYMYIPVDVQIPDDDLEEQQQAQQQTTAVDAQSQLVACAEEQPLDYSCTALQLECVGSDNSSQLSPAAGNGSDDDGDVEMG